MYSNVHGPDHLERFIPSVYSLLDRHSEGTTDIPFFHFSLILILLLFYFPML